MHHLEVNKHFLPCRERKPQFLVFQFLTALPANGNTLLHESTRAHTHTSYEYEMSKLTLQPVAITLFIAYIYLRLQTILFAFVLGNANIARTKSNAQIK